MQRAQRRKYHYIYKTTCIITNKFYIGMHSTDNLEDGYIGSGKRLWYSINKHGKENHVCQILEFLPDRNSLKVRENEIVNQEMLGEELCMNLRVGGEGGWTHLSKEDLTKNGKKGATGFVNRLKEDPEFAKEVHKRLYLANKGNKNWLGKHHNRETILKMKESKKGHGVGDTNSQYGKCWITNGVESQKIYKGDSIPEGWKLGRKM